MTCTKIQIPGGGVAIVCTRGRRSGAKKCITCSGRADIECDGCDKPICGQHSLSPRKNLDFCQACTTPLKRWWLEHDGATFAGEAKSLLLMRFIQWARSNWQRFPRSEWSAE